MSYTTIDTNRLHRVYEKMSVVDKDAIDAAYSAAVKVFRDRTICDPATDDRAEQLIAALTHYVVESRKS